MNCNSLVSQSVFIFSLFYSAISSPLVTALACLDGFLSGKTQSFISEESEPLTFMLFSSQGCCTCLFSLLMEQGSTRSWPRESPAFLTCSSCLHCITSAYLPLQIRFKYSCHRGYSFSLLLVSFSPVGALVAAVAYSSVGTLLCLLARMCSLWDQDLRTCRARVVGIKTINSPSGSLKW